MLLLLFWAVFQTFILIPCGYSAPYMPLLLVDIQHLCHVAVKAVIDGFQYFCVFVYGGFAHPKNLCSAPHSITGFGDITSDSFAAGQVWVVYIF